MTEDILVRRTTFQDIDAVHQIKQEQFPNPWKKQFFYDELEHNISNFFVAVDPSTGEVAGYVIFWIIEETLELHDIAVKESCKRRGVASRLIDSMLAAGVKRKVKEMFLEVRASNVGAIALYEKYNFKRIGTRKEYYDQPVEDAAIFALYPKDPI